MLNQKHIDYVFSIDTPKNKTSYQQTLHSSWGVESAAYKFDTTGIFKPRVTIDAILFPNPNSMLNVTGLG